MISSSRGLKDCKIQQGSWNPKNCRVCTGQRRMGVCARISSVFIGLGVVPCTSDDLVVAIAQQYQILCFV